MSEGAAISCQDDLDAELPLLSFGNSRCSCFCPLRAKSLTERRRRGDVLSWQRPSRVIFILLHTTHVYVLIEVVLQPLLNYVQNRYRLVCTRAVNPLSELHIVLCYTENLRMASQERLERCQLHAPRRKRKRTTLKAPV